MNQSKKTIKRYSLALPEELFNELQRVADEKQTSIVEVLRKYIKVGLLLESIENSPDSTLLIREGGTERQIILI